MAQRMISRRVGVAVFDEDSVRELNGLLGDGWHIETIAEHDLGYLVVPLESPASLRAGRGISIAPAQAATFDERVLAVILTEGTGPRLQQLVVSDLDGDYLDVNAIRRESSMRFPGWEMAFTSRLNAYQALSLLER